MRYPGSACTCLSSTKTPPFAFSRTAACGSSLLCEPRVVIWRVESKGCHLLLGTRLLHAPRAYAACPLAKVHARSSASSGAWLACVVRSVFVSNVRHRGTEAVYGTDKHTWECIRYTGEAAHGAYFEREGSGSWGVVSLDCQHVAVCNNRGREIADRASYFQRHHKLVPPPERFGIRWGHGTLLLYGWRKVHVYELREGLRRAKPKSGLSRRSSGPRLYYMST